MTTAIEDDFDAITKEFESGLDDPDAPYGRFANGKPRKNPRKSDVRSDIKPPGRRPGRPRVKKSEGPDYRKMAEGLVGLPTALLFMVGTARKSGLLIADAGAIAMHSSDLSQGIAEVAEQDVRVAGMLEKMANVGPYGTLLTASIGLVMQLGANHGRVPVGAMNTVPPNELAESMMAQQKEAQEAYERQRMAEQNEVNVPRGS